MPSKKTAISTPKSFKLWLEENFDLMFSIRSENSCSPPSSQMSRIGIKEEVHHVNIKSELHTCSSSSIMPWNQYFTANNGVPKISRNLVQSMIKQECKPSIKQEKGYLPAKEVIKQEPKNVKILKQYYEMWKNDRVLSQHSTSQGDSKECIIWVQHIKDQMARPAAWDHLFCYSCLTDWWKVTNLWPLWKLEFFEVVKLQYYSKLYSHNIFNK